MCMPMAISVCFLKTCRTVSSSEWHTLTSDDTGCMPGKVLKHRTAPQWFYKHVMDKGRKKCFNFAKRLCEIADVSTEKQCSINDIECFEKVIPSKLGNKFIRISENETGRKKAFLYLIDDNECGHFAAIVSITGFFCCSFFCEDCLKPYSDKDRHSCQTLLTGNSLSCRACNRTCRSIACFQRHIEENTTKKGLSYTECCKRYEYVTESSLFYHVEHVLKKHQGKCTHNEQERIITGTYATPEIMLAKEKGYRVLKLYEVWHFPDDTQYDKNTNSGGLFTDYIQMFLKIKPEGRGFSQHCQTEEEKRLYKENEGINLDYDNIKVNPGLRSLAELCLNSFWGKFGQRLLLKKHALFHESEADKFFQIISDPTKVVENFHIVSNDTIQLEWTQNSKFPPVDAKTNIFIAIFTTMWARLKLYEGSDMLEDRVLYTDTDSCIYVSQKGKPELSLGKYLGELTSEIPADEGNVVEFVSGGPKNYAYRTLKTKTCKVKGFTLNVTNSYIVNFN
ncbi:unnamed protein product [Mytilus coruscus]|uniref:Uncharacterized protein n=1 Tax=Mytilus coruscus TaxID=42192 RepID=A0A6J8CG76_MYTCO|nr:unnamed protein product [Mytilus coruscus]